MDERDRRQIEVGAGLQESRLNTELIEFLQKWGPRALYVLLAVVLAYLGWNKWQAYRQAQLDKAFAEYHLEQASQNPDVLLAIAEKHDGMGSIWSLATLDASDLLLTAGRLGVRPGIGPNVATDADAITPEERQSMFRFALEHYQTVLDRNSEDPRRARFAQKARWGVISARISLGELDEARAMLQEYIGVAEKHAFIENLSLGKQRLELLSKLAEPIPVYTSSELPEANRPLVQMSGAASTAVGPASSALGIPGATLQSGESLPLRKLDPEEARRRLRGEAPPDGSTTDTPESAPDASGEPGAEAPDPTATPSEPGAETPAEPTPEPGADEPN